jgi:hypothetical protein
MTKLIVAFRNFANAPKNNIFSMSGISAQDHFLLQPAVSCSLHLYSRISMFVTDEDRKNTREHRNHER